MFQPDAEASHWDWWLCWSGSAARLKGNHKDVSYTGLQVNKVHQAELIVIVSKYQTIPLK